ncbi:hypothetical protein HYU23_00915 [Candidatus Woesearchaeota archaeon]|nr:hypothetical protein [Candidatus Woesearchaeota archaeon]
MARILYGVVSIGLGHAMRSKVILDHLKKQGHKIFIVTSHKVYDYYKNYYDNVYNIEGLEIVFRKNAILNLRTLIKNLQKASKKTYYKLVKVKEAIDKFNPEIVISDMETFSTYIANEKNTPSITIDNQHYLIYGKFKVPEKYKLSYLKALMIVKGIVFKTKYYLIMTLPGSVIENKPNIFQIKPVIREEILKSKSKSMDYVFVYQSTKSYDKLIEILKRINYKFIIYGFDKNQVVGNLIFKKFDDRKQFINDLANCKAVITNGGFTLISEALYLSKPMLVVPIKKHFEQVSNALYIQYNNFGVFYDDLDETHVVEFIMNLKKYKFDKVEKWNNEQTFGLLDMLIRKETK